MAIGGFVGVDNSARTIKDIFIGVDGVARRVIKAYVGDANGQAKLWWDGGKIFPPSISYVIFENGEFNYVPEGLDIENNIVDAKDYAEFSENANYYDIAVLSEFFLTNKTLWIHLDSIETVWDIDEMLCINSHNNEFSKQFAINAIYIPINRINSPTKLKVTGRGNLSVVPMYYDEASNNLLGEVENTIDICDMDSKEYEINLDSCSYIDYIRIGARHKGKAWMADSYGSTGYSWIYYEINSLSCKKNESDEYFFQVTEGWAFGVIAIAGGTERVFFYSLEPFTVVEKNSSQSFTTSSPYSYRDRTYYCISVLNLGINDNVEGSIDYTYYTIQSGVSDTDREQLLRDQIGYYLFLENIFVQPPSPRPASVIFNDQPPQISGIDSRWYDLLEQPVKFVTNKPVSIITTYQELNIKSNITGLKPLEHTTPVYGMAYYIPNHNHQRGVILVSKESFTYSTEGLYEDLIKEAVPFKVDNSPVCYYAFSTQSGSYSGGAIRNIKEVSSAVLSRGEVPSGLYVDTYNVGWTYGFDDPILSFVFSYMIENGEITEGIDEDTIALMSLQQVSKIEIICGEDNSSTPEPEQPDDPTPGPDNPNPTEPDNPNPTEPEEPITQDPTEPESPTDIVEIENGYWQQPIEFATDSITMGNKTVAIPSGAVGFVYKNIPREGYVQYVAPIVSKTTFANSSEVTNNEIRYYINANNSTTPVTENNDNISISVTPTVPLKAINIRLAAWEAAYIADQRGLL